MTRSTTRQHKYNAKPTVVDNIRFASMKEARRSDMSPSCATNDEPDGSRVHAESCGDVLVDHVLRHGPYLEHLSFSEPREAVRTATLRRSWLRESARPCVSGVVFRRARIQVLWTNAWRVIAVMAHKPTLRDGAEVKLVGEAVGIRRATVHPNGAVSLAGGVPVPDPTSISLFNVRPEAINRRAVTMREETLSRAVLAVFSGAWANVSGERCAAMKAIAL